MAQGRPRSPTSNIGPALRSLHMSLRLPMHPSVRLSLHPSSHASHTVVAGKPRLPCSNRSTYRPPPKALCFALRFFRLSHAVHNLSTNSPQPFHNLFPPRSLRAPDCFVLDPRNTVIHKNWSWPA